MNDYRVSRNPACPGATEHQKVKHAGGMIIAQKAILCDPEVVRFFVSALTIPTQGAMLCL